MELRKLKYPKCLRCGRLITGFKVVAGNPSLPYGGGYLGKSCAELVSSRQRLRSRFPAQEKSKERTGTDGFKYWATDTAESICKLNRQCWACEDNTKGRLVEFCKLEMEAVASFKDIMRRVRKRS